MARVYWRRAAPAALAAAGGLAAAGTGASWLGACEERAIPETEVRQHRSRKDAWVSYNGAVYDITGFVTKHPPCDGLDWVERVAGRRFEHFLGMDSFAGPHLHHLGPDRKTMHSKLAKILEPYRLGTLTPEPPSAAAKSWPDVDPNLLELRIEYADGRLARTIPMSELRERYPKVSYEVTHVCQTTQETTSSKRWEGVRVRELLPPSERPDGKQWNPLVTFIGMDGFGYSFKRKKAEEDNVLLAYEQDGTLLDVEKGGPLRLVKDGQHAKWVEKIIVE